MSFNTFMIGFFIFIGIVLTIVILYLMYDFINTVFGKKHFIAGTIKHKEIAVLGVSETFNTTLYMTSGVPVVTRDDPQVHYDIHIDLVDDTLAIVDVKDEEQFKSFTVNDIVLVQYKDGFFDKERYFLGMEK